MRRGMLAAALLAAAFLISPAGAQDAQRGRALAATACVACHGDDGRSRMAGVPSLAGQQEEFITIQMILFREGLRQVPAMTAMAANLPDKDIQDLAAWFASLPAGTPTDRRPRDAALYAAGQALVGPRHCNVCHLPTFLGRNQVPRLVGQREDFLAHTLKEYRDGRRVGADTQMNDAVRGMADADIAALAHYLSHHD